MNSDDLVGRYNLWHAEEIAAFVPVPADLTTEQALVARAQGGETEAVAQLYELHAPAVFRYLYFRVHELGNIPRV